MEKISEEMLKHYYETDKNFFNTYANYFYKEDPEYYTKQIAPYFKQRTGITCPFCHNQITPKNKPEYTSAAITMFVFCGISGFFAILFVLAKSEILFYMFGFISLLLMIFAFNSKRFIKICPKCNLQIGKQ